MLQIIGVAHPVHEREEHLEPMSYSDLVNQKIGLFWSPDIHRRHLSIHRTRTLGIVLCFVPKQIKHVGHGTYCIRIAQVWRYS